MNNLVTDIYDTKNLAIYHDDGTYITSLNKNLVIKQKLSGDKIELLKLSHIQLNLIFKFMETTNNQHNLINLAEMVDNIESIQQLLWGFANNKSMRRWFEVPKCTCPKLDNIDLLSLDNAIISENCIIHGNFINYDDIDYE